MYVAPNSKPTQQTKLIVEMLGDFWKTFHSLLGLPDPYQDLEVAIACGSEPTFSTCFPKFCKARLADSQDAEVRSTSKLSSILQALNLKT